MSLLPITNDIPFRDISKLVLSNSAFKNPFGEIISSTTSTLNGFRQLVTDASNILNPSYNAGIASNSTSIITAVTSLETSIGRFFSHSNNISGVSLSNGLNGANFATISSIVSTVQQYRNDGSICELVNKAFGAIMNASILINQFNFLLNRLADAANIPDQIVAHINFLILRLEQQIEADLLAFANAQIEALQYAASAAINALIGNKCIGEVISRVGSRELKNIVRERTREIF